MTRESERSKTESSAEDSAAGRVGTAKMVKSRTGLRRCVAESETHRSMKSIVRKELERERYTVVEEPFYPPTRVSWTSYRPDLMGYRSESGTEEVVLVECETRPSIRKLMAKNSTSAWFQPHLFGRGSLRRVIAVPQGKLKSINMRARGAWEVWVIGSSSSLERIPPLEPRMVSLR